MRTSILLAFALLLTAACGDDVTNNYYTQETETPDSPQESPLEQGDWLADARSLCNYGLLSGEEHLLYPSWLLQAEGVKHAYSDSEFARTFITDGIALRLRNPGAGNRITLRMSESPLCHASEKTLAVPDGTTDEYLTLEYPVNWNFPALLGWKEAGMVNLEWTLLLDGVEADRFVQTFQCLGLYQLCEAIVCSYETDPDEVEAIRQTDIGSYPVKEGDQYLYLYNLPFMMGYITDNSPLLDRLKKEVIEDGYLPFLYGSNCTTTTDLVDCTARAFNYLTMKYRIDFSPMSYPPASIRPIDEVFSHRLASEGDIVLTFAAWCQSQGVPCFVEQLPVGKIVHVENRIEGNTFPMVPVWTVQTMYQFPDFTQLPQEALFQSADDWFEYVDGGSRREEEEMHRQGRIDTPWLYCDIDVAALRPFLPAFGTGANHGATRATTSPEREMRLIGDSLPIFAPQLER